MAQSTRRKNGLPPIVFIGAGVICFASFSLVWPRLTQKNVLPQAQSLEDRLSLGEKLLIAEAASSEKKLGVQAFAKGDYTGAIASFESSLLRSPNDPEALIYLNNARNIGQQTFKIAVSAPIGSDLNGAKEILRGAAQAQQEFNQSTEAGNKKLIIQIANDDNSPQVAQELAQQFIKQSDILGVVGHYASSVTLAAAPFYEQGKLSVISPVSSAVQLSNKSRFVFRTVPSDYAAARALADYMLNQIKRKNAVVYFDSKSTYSKSLKSEFSTAIALQGGQVSAEYDLANSGLSIRESLSQAQQQGATAIMLAATTSTLDRALQIAQTNDRRLPILGGDDVYSPKILEVCREQCTGLTVAIPWHGVAESSKSFANRAKRLWRGEVSWRTVTSYDAVRSLITASQQQLDTDRNAVQEALASPNFTAQGASAPIRFLPSGDRSSSIQLVTVTKGMRSGFGFDFNPTDALQ